MSQQIEIKKLIVDLKAGVKTPVDTKNIRTPFFELWACSLNNGPIYVGDSKVDTTCIPRSPGYLMSFSGSSNASFSVGDFFDLSKIFLTTDNTGNKVVVQYFAAGELRRS